MSEPKAKHFHDNDGCTMCFGEEISELEGKLEASENACRQQDKQLKAMATQYTDLEFDYRQKVEEIEQAKRDISELLNMMPHYPEGGKLWKKIDGIRSRNDSDH